MFLILLALVLFMLFRFSHRRERARLRNGALLLASAFLAALAVLSWLEHGPVLGTMISIGMLVLIPLTTAVLVFFLLANGLLMFRREGRSLGNLLSLAAGIGLMILIVALVALVLSGEDVLLAAGAAVLVLCGYFSFIFSSFLTGWFSYSRSRRRNRGEYVVVLGMGLIRGRVTPLLASRLDAALALRTRDQGPGGRAPILVTGGQGDDESRSEATAMAEYLAGHGVRAEEILIEDRARTTRENLTFSRVVMASAANRPAGEPMPGFVVVTNNFHVFRTAILARQLGLDTDVIGSPTAKYFLPSAVLREFGAVFASQWWIHSVIAAVLLAATVLVFSRVL